MRREPPWDGAGTGKVLHVVGRLTDEVFSFLGPATHALARSGHEQAIVMIDAAHCRHHLVGLHESVELVLTPSLRNPIARWQAVLQACRRSMAGGRLHAVHLHGVLPALVGVCAMRAEGVATPMLYSPHGSRSLGLMRAIGALASLRLVPMLRGARGTAVVSLPRETVALERWTAVELVESPVSDAFFAMARREESARSVERFAQLAVLLGGEALRISFNWIGSVDEVSRLRLTAASVGVFDVSADAETAARLSAGWAYVAPGGTRGFPLLLIQAMASGLPCVALDSEPHREVIRDGETGFLCETEGDMIARIAMLIDDPALRGRLGAAARAEAKRRFDESTFGARLLAAYALPA
jgi:hypothetical protein